MENLLTDVGKLCLRDCIVKAIELTNKYLQDNLFSASSYSIGEIATNLFINYFKKELQSTSISEETWAWYRIKRRINTKTLKIQVEGLRSAVHISDISIYPEKSYGGGQAVLSYMKEITDILDYHFYSVPTSEVKEESTFTKLSSISDLERELSRNLNVIDSIQIGSPK